MPKRVCTASRRVIESVKFDTQYDGCLSVMRWGLVGDLGGLTVRALFEHIYPIF